MNITLIINEDQYTCDVEPRTLLIDVLRDILGLTGTKRSCDSQVCGACTVLIDAVPKSSCSLFAVDCVGTTIQTIESGSIDPDISRIQDAFVRHGSIQCGFCTPGMIMTTKSLLIRKREGFEDDTRHFLHGNICRCTGYIKILDAVNEILSESNMGEKQDAE